MIRKENIYKFFSSPLFAILVIFLLLNIFFIVKAPNSFFQLSNYVNILRQSATIILVASAATILMMTGNIDLSTGSVVAFSAVIYALCVKSGLSLIAGAAIAIMGGIIVGLINGMLVTKFNFPPFIATLGTMYVCRGIALILANGTTVRDDMPPQIFYLAEKSFLSIPIYIWIVIIALTVFIFIEKKTLLGKYALAIGGNKNAAVFSGINTGTIILVIYIVVGIAASFAGIMTASRLGAGDPRGAYGFEFDVILAILLGGTKLSGGKGSVIGTFIGAVIITILGNGLSMLNILIFWQNILKGVMFILIIVLYEKVLKNIGNKSLISSNS
jgi:ribose/xylose/arabinose/galactoside ABC-type transport system permease subunit